jgi:hypothetical protein
VTSVDCFTVKESKKITVRRGRTDRKSGRETNAKEGTKRDKGMKAKKREIKWVRNKDKKKSSKGVTCACAEKCKHVTEYPEILSKFISVHPENLKKILHCGKWYGRFTKFPFI